MFIFGSNSLDCVWISWSETFNNLKIFVQFRVLVSALKEIHSDADRPFRSQTLPTICQNISVSVLVIFSYIESLLESNLRQASSNLRQASFNMFFTFVYISLYIVHTAFNHNIVSVFFLVNKSLKKKNKWILTYQIIFL